MNRAGRRRVGMKVVSEMLKGRAKAMAKKQYGFGFVITNRMICITFWRWVWVPWDRRFEE